MTARRQSLDPAHEAALRAARLSNTAERERQAAIQQDGDEADPHNRWRSSLVRSLYADSGDPDRPARGRG